MNISTIVAAELPKLRASDSIRTVIWYAKAGHSKVHMVCSKIYASKTCQGAVFKLHERANGRWVSECLCHYSLRKAQSWTAHMPALKKRFYSYTIIWICAFLFSSYIPRKSNLLPHNRPSCCRWNHNNRWNLGDIQKINQVGARMSTCFIRFCIFLVAIDWYLQWNRSKPSSCQKRRHIFSFVFRRQLEMLATIEPHTNNSGLLLLTKRGHDGAQPQWMRLSWMKKEKDDKFGTRNNIFCGIFCYCYLPLLLLLLPSSLSGPQPCLGDSHVIYVIGVPFAFLHVSKQRQRPPIDSPRSLLLSCWICHCFTVVQLCKPLLIVDCFLWITVYAWNNFVWCLINNQ